MKTPPLANVRCLDYVQRTTGVEHLTQVYGRANGSLRAKMLRGKNFKLSGNVTQPWGNGTLRLSWTLTFTRMR